LSLTELVVSIDSDADIAAVANLRYGSLWIGCIGRHIAARGDTAIATLTMDLNSVDSLVTDAAFIGEPWGCFSP